MQKQWSKYVYLWIDTRTDEITSYRSRKKLSEERSIPVHLLNYRMGRCGMNRLKINDHQEVRRVPYIG